VSLPPFQALLDAHRGDLYRFLVASVGPSDADDCFQETVIAALRAYPKVRDDSNLRGWLLKIGQRKAIDSHRATGRRPLPVATLPERGAGGAAGVVNSEPELWGAVRGLPPKQRTAVFCRSVMGMPYAELADLLDCSDEAARRSVHEGLKRLREEWSA
jgi:DNA-directed RNA polymerase specialized sigma24 family protein